MRRSIVAISIVACTATEASAQWTETILVDSQPTSTSRGFDGGARAFDDNLDEIYCSAAEQATSNNVIVAAVDGSFVQTWGTLQGGEDVMCGVDLNFDGFKDVAVASEGQNRIRIWYGPFVDVGGNGIHDNAATFVTLQVIPTGGSINQAWIKLEVADADCDGDVDLIAGGKRVNGNAAAWGWFEFISGTTFTWHEQGAVGWVMQLQALDWDGDSPCKDDIFITDKTGAAGVGTNRGAWVWLNNGSGTYNGTQHQQENGDEQFGFARDLNFDDCTDFIHGTASAIEIAISDCDGTYTVEAVAFPADTTAGAFHAPTLCPDTTIDGPFILSFALATGSDSGVVMIERNGASWDRTEISGPSGDVGVTRKWDNAYCGGLAGNHYLLTTEGGDGSGADDKGIVLFTEAP